MHSKKEKRFYPRFYVDRPPEMIGVEYTLWFVNDVLVDIRNEYMFSVEKNSECWQFFNNKYKNQCPV